MITELKPLQDSVKKVNLDKNVMLKGFTYCSELMKMLLLLKTN